MNRKEKKNQSACTLLYTAFKTIKQRIGKSNLTMLGSYRFHLCLLIQLYLLVQHFDQISSRLIIRYERKVIVINNSLIILRISHMLETEDLLSLTYCLIVFPL